MKEKKLFREVKSKKFMKKFFEKIIKEFFPPGSLLKGIKVKDVGKLKFKKALKYELRLKTPEGKEVTKIIRGNIPSKDTKEEIRIADKSQKMLYRKGFAFTPFQVPLSLGFYSKLNLVLYEDYPGKPFTQYLCDNHKDLKYLTKQSALWLARLHDLSLKEGKARPFSLIKKEVGYFKENYKNYYPGVYSIGSNILEKSLTLFNKYVFSKKNQFILTHGDFNPNNIIIKGNSIGIIDWGRSCIFDPISDLGNLMAQLNLLFWYKKANPRIINQVKKSFINTYLEARHLKFSDIKHQFLTHELWWIMQIIAYSVSIWPTQKASIAALKGIQKAKEICATLGLDLKEDLIRKKRRASIKEIFTDKETMMKLFNNNLRAFFPSAKNIISLEIDQPEALSTSSFLTRMKLELATPQNKRISKVIRGNIISPETWQIMKYTYKNNTSKLLSMRPLFYFRHIRYVLYEEISGLRLREIKPKNRKYPEYIKKSAWLLAELHNLKKPDITRRKIEEHDFFKYIKNKIKKYDEKNYSQINTYVSEYLKQAKNSFKKSKRVLSHNDFQASNIIITPENKIALIDFTLSSLFYPSYDVANFITHLEIMLNRILTRKKFNHLHVIFLQNYFKRLKKGLARQVKKNLPLMRIRSALDIWTITTTLLGPKDRNRKRYVSLLKNIIEENLK